MAKKKGQATTIVLYAVFVFYVCFLLWNILFKYCSPLELFSQGREVHRSVNLIPLKEIIHSRGLKDLNIYGNVILFLPFGVYVQVLRKEKNIWKGILYGAAASATLEIIQLIFGLGATDIDDVILNAAGTALGILVYKALYYIFRKRESYVRGFVAWGSAAVCLAVSALVIILFTYN